MPEKQKKSTVKANDSCVSDTSYDLQTLSKLVNELQQSLVEVRQMLSNKNDKLLGASAGLNPKLTGQRDLVFNK